MAERSNIDSIKQMAKKSHRTLTFKEIPYPISTGIHQFQKYKRMGYMEDQTGNSNYFVWYSDHYSKMAEYQIFCGVFIPVDLPKNIKINIRSRHILDQLNPFETRMKTNSDIFDKQVSVRSNDDAMARKFLSKSRLQKSIIESLKIDPGLQISINEMDVDFVKPLENKSHLSILNEQSWLVEKKEVDGLILAMEGIQRNL